MSWAPVNVLGSLSETWRRYSTNDESIWRAGEQVEHTGAADSLLTSLLSALCSLLITPLVWLVVYQFPSPNSTSNAHYRTTGLC